MKSAYRNERLALRIYLKWYSSPLLRSSFLLFSVFVYSLSLYFFVPTIGVMTNYAVILPIIAASFAFGSAGGIISGALALISNNLIIILAGYPEFIQENSLIAQLAGMAVGTTMGVLGSHHRELVREIFHSRDLEFRLRNSVEERTLLLREIHHRVKNNLNVIHSLIGLQSGLMRDPQYVDVLTDLSRRIGSMAFVHDRLNDAPLAGGLRLSLHLPHLVEHILSSYSTKKVEVDFQVEPDLPDIGISRATTLGLIVNEVVVNSLKHAFLGVNNPKLRVSAWSRGDEIALRIVDNGIGFRPEGVKRGLGLSLIEVLIRQLGGEYRYEFNNQTEFILGFPQQNEADNAFESSPIRSGIPSDTPL